MKNRYIYKPVVFLLIFFLLDKIFLLDFFKNDFLQTGNVIYYQHRKMLLERLLVKKDKEKKLVIAFGDSRAYSFSDLALPEHIKKSWEIYNFAAPQAAPVYSYFMLEKMIEKGIHPDVIFFVISPEGFDDKKRLIHSPFFRLAADEAFIKKYWNEFPAEDKNRYVMDKVFAVQGAEFDLQLFVRRLLGGKMEDYEAGFNQDIMILNLYKGEFLGYTAPFNDEKSLDKHASQLKSIYLNNFSVDETQFRFVEKLYALAKTNNIKVISIWPKVYPGYKQGFDELGLQEKWWKRIVAMSSEYGMLSIDFNKEAKCNIFYDASHQSVQCIKEQVEILINGYL